MLFSKINYILFSIALHNWLTIYMLVLCITFILVILLDTYIFDFNDIDAFTNKVIFVVTILFILYLCFDYIYNCYTLLSFIINYFGFFGTIYVLFIINLGQISNIFEFISISTFLFILIILILICILLLIRCGAPRYKIEQISNYTYNILIFGIIILILVILVLNVIL